ncbi:MAG: long-chain fatty acid--CoA ligase, partial [Bacteroidetes bacterium]|nr:long-chain fatty acid--CoA ligase [Bacteroidota bacterium]
MVKTPQTILEMLQRNAADFPDREAAIAHLYRIGEWNTVTWKELDEITDRVAAGLADLGVKQGQKVAFLHGNSLESYYSYLAVHKLGAMFVPVNIRLVPREVKFILDHADTEHVIVGNDYLELIDEIRADLNIKNYICIEKQETPLPDWTVSFAGLLASQGAVPEVKVLPSDEADLLYTSGTTGFPKGVVLTQSAKVSCGQMVGASWGCSRKHYGSERIQNVFPFFTSTGVSSVLMSWLYYGMTVILEPTFDVGQTLETIQRVKSTIYMGAPAMFIFILADPKFKEYNTSSLRGIGYGGSAMPEEMIRQIMDTWPGVKIVNMYGLTEGGTGGTCLPPADTLTKLGSIGVPWPPDQEARIVDENDQDVAVGEVGEIVIRGPNVMKEYYKNPEATKEVMKNGWLHTGDMGRYDEDGYFFYTDRKKDMIVRGGFNVYPVEVESVLFEHPAVMQCAVMGKPHDALGEDVLAYIILNPGHTLTADELKEFCVDKLADFKRPREIIF